MSLHRKRRLITHHGPIGRPLRLRWTLALALLTPAAAAAQQHTHQHEHGNVGTVNFRASCAPAVQEDFNRAVALLHHMMYTEARAEFEGIAARDPQCAMAHWGVAMSRFQPLWPGRPGLEERQRGWAAVERARALQPRTERERALVAAVDAFWREPDAEEWWPRVRRWNEAMAQVRAAHPDDPDVAAFYALSVIATGLAAENQLEYNARAAVVLAQIHERTPNHPGAMHYTIHANDATGRAGESLEITRGYDAIAPNVPHALHMPTHIFVRLGEWPEVIEWNRKSADAALKYPVRDRVSVHHIHALDYLVYAYLQRGEDAAARAVAEEVSAAGTYVDDFTAAFHLAAIPARIAVERRAWQEAAAITPRTPGYVSWDRYLWAESIGWFARGLGAVGARDLAAARGAESRMRELAAAAQEAGERGMFVYIETDRLVLSGRIALAEGEKDAAVARMREAAALEKTVQKHAITPGALLPPDEALGDLLSELGRPAEALAAYEASLATWPKRYNSLVGAARAAHAAGESAKAQQYYAQLLEATEGTATTRPEIGEARTYLERARAAGR
jgi:tetratricopeptide (TPR) repeat protein